MVILSPAHDSCITHVYVSQENPNEEDAAIVDKVLSMRLTKKEVSVLIVLFSVDCYYLGILLILRSCKSLCIMFVPLFIFKGVSRTLHQC